MAGKDRPQDLAEAEGDGHQRDAAARIAAAAVTGRDQAERRQADERAAEKDRRDDDAGRLHPQGTGGDAHGFDQVGDDVGAQHAPTGAQCRPESDRRHGAQADHQPDVGFEMGDRRRAAHQVDDEGGGDDVAETEQAIGQDQRGKSRRATALALGSRGLLHPIVCGNQQGDSNAGRGREGGAGEPEQGPGRMGAEQGRDQDGR